MTIFTPKQLNLSSLPSIPLDERKNLPECSGIYFAINSAGEIQYIGRSTNIRQRWLQHHRYTQLKALGSVQIAWLQVSDSLLLPGIESALIEYFQPLLNNTEAQEWAARRTRARTAQVGVKVDSALYERYKTKLRIEGISITDAIEAHMRDCLGEVYEKSDSDCGALRDRIDKLEQDFAEIKQWLENRRIEQLSDPG
jgi:hypothetical protein